METPHGTSTVPSCTRGRSSIVRRWRRGAKVPRTLESMEILGRIERRYPLPEGYFKAKLPPSLQVTRQHDIAGISPSERRRIAWHLPDDFDRRPRRNKRRSWSGFVPSSSAAPPTIGAARPPP